MVFRLVRAFAQQYPEIGIELIDALRLLIETDLDALERPYQLVDLAAEIFVLQTADIEAAARKIGGGDDAPLAGGSPIAKTALGRCHNNLFQTRSGSDCFLIRGADERREVVANRSR